MFHTVADDVAMIAANVDEFGDSYCRDVNVDSLRKVGQCLNSWNV
jgi:hypothetical protein